VHISTDEEPNLRPPWEGTVGFDGRGPAQGTCSLYHVRRAPARFLDRLPYDGQRKRLGWWCLVFVCRHSFFHLHDSARHVPVSSSERPRGNVGGTWPCLQPTTFDVL
jgi:hypothetical protein